MNGNEFVQLHSIFADIVKDPLGGSPPLPECVQQIQGPSGSLHADATVSEDALRWLELLNMGVDPHRLRQALQKPETDEATIRALIRYLVSKKSHLPLDREKVDWLVTHLFQVWEERDRDPGGSFSTEIEAILEGCEFPSLSPHCEELLMEIPSLLEELTYFQRFSQITESRIIQRGRNLKSQFEEEFFHPTVLAAIVNYNLLLGKKMSGLLQQTIQAVTRSTPAARAELPDAQEVLQRDYRTISESGVFHRFTELDRQAELDRGLQRTQELKREKDQEEKAKQSQTGAVRPGEATPPSLEEQLIGLGIDPGRQAERLRNRIKEIALRMRSNPSEAPLPSALGSLRLSDWEAKAFLTEYPAAEESFRAYFGRGVTTTIGILSRIEEELPSYFETKGAEHIWKRHCDALVYLLYEGRRQLELLKKLSDDSGKRGLQEKSKQLFSTAEKLESYLNRLSTLF